MAYIDKNPVRDALDHHNKILESLNEMLKQDLPEFNKYYKYTNIIQYYKHI